MNQQYAGVKASLTGVALLAACACGTSSRLATLANTYGGAASSHMIHPLFLAVGGAAILVGLWKRQRRLPFFAVIGLALLMLGELLVPAMSMPSGSQFHPSQLLGLFSYMVAAVFLVFAFYRAYPSKRPGAALTAMTGAAMATGCECCAVTMGIVGTLQLLLPLQAWLPHTLPIYAVAIALMAIGLGRLGGLLPVLLAVAGQAWVYFWLELPYAKLPAMMFHGVSANFLIKYPMMLLGTLTVMSAFALAFRTQEARVIGRIAEPAVAGD